MPATRVDGHLGPHQVSVSIDSPAPATEAGTGFKLSWETFLGIVGAAAAIGLWINVVGGAVVWARLESVDLPAAEVVGIVPNSTLLAIGLRALILPLVVAAVAVGLLYLTWERPAERPPERAGEVTGESLPKELWNLVKIVFRSRERLWTPTTPSRTSAAGINRVTLLLAVLGFVTVFALFGGHVESANHQEWIFAWAIASPFLVLGAVTYRPVNLWLATKTWRSAALLLMAVAGFLAIWLGGLAAGHGQAAVCVALIAPVAALIARFVLPGKVLLGLSAGVLLILAYLALGLLLFLWPGDGDITFDATDQMASLTAALLANTVALLLVRGIASRTTSFVRLAAVMFAVVAAWGGIVGYLRERNGSPRFDLTALLRKPETGADKKQVPRLPVSGYLIARTDDAVLVAQRTGSFDPEAWRIVVIPRDQVEEMVIGPPCVMTDKQLDVAESMATELQQEHDRQDTGTFTASNAALAACSERSAR